MSAHLDSRALRLEWTIAHEHDGSRADIYLSTKIGRLSRNKAKRIIEAGDFRRSDSILRPSQILRFGETVCLWRMPPEEKTLDLTSVRVIFEDQDWLAIDKPPDLAVHPSARYLHNTLTAWLKRYAPGLPVHPCHRLDRETSGILMCAKNRHAESVLKTSFQKGLVEKTYLAIVRGQLSHALDINAPLALQGSRGTVRIRMIVDENDGLVTRTLISPLAYDPLSNRSLVKCLPKTGRQHQIRAHLAHAGYPIVGDKLYSMGDDFFDAYTKRNLGEEMLELEHSRHALHAFSLAFDFQGQRRIFTAPIPQDFGALLPPNVLSTIPIE